jgi:hypothetical protein
MHLHRQRFLSIDQFHHQRKILPLSANDFQRVLPAELIQRPPGQVHWFNDHTVPIAVDRYLPTLSNPPRRQVPIENNLQIAAAPDLGLVNRSKLQGANFQVQALL